MEPTWGRPGADRAQVGPMLAPWSLLSGWWWTTADILSNLIIFYVVLFWNYACIVAAESLIKYCFGIQIYQSSIKFEVMQHSNNLAESVIFIQISSSFPLYSGKFTVNRVRKQMKIMFYISWLFHLSQHCMMMKGINHEAANYEYKYGLILQEVTQSMFFLLSFTRLLLE